MSQLFFTNDHEWILVEGNVATVGITFFAQEQLGDIVFVELPNIGTTVHKGDAAVVIESVKAASDVYVPVDGDIIEINEKLNDEPALVNSHPEGIAWLWKMNLSDLSQLETLMDKDAYLAMVG